VLSEDEQEIEIKEADEDVAETAKELGIELHDDNDARMSRDSDDELDEGEEVEIEDEEVGDFSEDYLDDDFDADEEE